VHDNSIIIDDSQIIREIFGAFDENINIIREELGVDIQIRDGEIRLYGDEIAVELGKKLIYNLIEIIKKQKRLDKQDLRYSIQL